MKFSSIYKSIFYEDKGSVAIITAVVLFFVLIGVAALAIDIGRLATTKNELQNIADAGALAGAGELGDRYYNGKYPSDNNWDWDDLRKVASDTGFENKIDGKNVIIRYEDINFGWWDGVAFANSGPNVQNAVKVIARKDNVANNPISTFFSNILGIDYFEPNALAIAAISARTEWEPGEVTMPFGISQEWFEHMHGYGNGICGGDIKLHPSSGGQLTDGCAGWTIFSDRVPNPTRLEQEVFIPIIEEVFVSPAIIAGETVFRFDTGVSGGAISDPSGQHYKFGNLFDDMKEDGKWSGTVLVYEAPCGSIQNETIVGVTNITVTGVDKTEQTVYAEVECILDDFRGEGGAWFGTYGRLPGLVK